jgi:DNA-directed RNA polymerase subunit M/transcription elongation factor TFIIS
MKFCTVCDNMYYVSINENNSNLLSYYCYNCGNKDETLTTGLCVLNTKIKKNDQSFHHIINKYTKFDPTLPRIYNIPCPNEECATHKTDDSRAENEVIYVRYDDINLKYLYICSVCDTKWKTNT